MCREMQGLAYVVSFDERRVARAVLIAPLVKICVFWASLIINFVSQKL